MDAEVSMGCHQSRWKAGLVCCFQNPCYKLEDLSAACVTDVEEGCTIKPHYVTPQHFCGKWDCHPKSKMLKPLALSRVKGFLVLLL